MVMLHNIWRKLAGKKASADLAATTQASPFELSIKEQSKDFSAPSINAIPDNYAPIWQLQKKRQILEVKVDGSTRSFQTLILAIDIPRGILWLDDLFPSQSLL